MQFQEEFSLESVLSVLTGINCTKDFNEVFELFGFIFEDPFINTIGIGELKDSACNHILNIHPELRGVKYDKSMNFDSWLNEQKKLYGDTLTISIIGEPIIILEKQSYTSLR